MFISAFKIGRHDDNGRRPQRQGRDERGRSGRVVRSPLSSGANPRAVVAMSAAAAVALSGLAISPISARVAVTAKTAVSGGPVTVPVTSDPTTTSTTTSVVGGSIAPVGAISFGRVVPGADASMGTGYFKATGSIGATITARPDVFNVVSITTYQVTKQLVSVDPGELPPGAKPVRTWQTVYTADQSVAGGGPLTIPSGDVVAITVGVRNAQAAAQGTMTLTSGAITQAIPLSLSVGAVKASLDSTNLTIAQGRSGYIDVSVRSWGPDAPDADVSFDVYHPVAGITIANPNVHVPTGQTVHAKLPVVVDRDAPLGPHAYNVAAHLLGEVKGLGDLTITVPPLPVQTVAIPLGGAISAWESVRAPACEVIKDQMGRAVLARLGRTIRDPQCSLSSLQLTTAMQGNDLVITGSAIGNRVAAWVTTPDGLPRDLDPYFFLFFDVQVSLTVSLPTALGGATGLWVKNVSLTIKSKDGVQSGSTTADIVQAVATAFGQGGAFQPISFALGNPGNNVTGQVNGALSALDGPLAMASKLGFTRIDFSLDPATQVLTVRLS